MHGPGAGIRKMGEHLVTFAYAKINLTLEILGKREDDYHEIRSVIQTIDLADILTFSPSEELELRFDDPALEKLDSPRVLITRAVELLWEKMGERRGVRIFHRKGIPKFSGLGSSAADAAAVLKALNKMWNLDLSQEELCELAARISSDAPFFIYGGTALLEGRGEKVRPLPPLPERWLVILNPPLKIRSGKTARAYSKILPSHYTGGEITQKLVKEIESGKLDEPPLFNVFEQVIYELYPELSFYRDLLLRAGARSVHLAGAGPALFSFVKSREEGEEMIRRLEGEKGELFLVRTVNARSSNGGHK